MKKNSQYIVIACILAVALFVMAAFALSGIRDDKISYCPVDKIPENMSGQNNQSTYGTRENTTFIDIHYKEGRRVLLYPEDSEYSVIESECLEQIHCINSQIKTGFSSTQLNGMKHNSTYVAINFSVPTTFETSYIIDGSPKMITIDEAIFFLNFEYEDIIITPMSGGPGVWETSCDRGELKRISTKPKFY